MESKLALKRSGAIQLWLAVVCFLIFVMVVVGGITRLTESGLSIVEWKPITGIVPPTSEAAWQLEFENYKQYPEYQKLNHGMSMDEFKAIFWWEFIHRLLGRLVGLVYLLPLLFFQFTGCLSSVFSRRLWIGFVLGGLQGLVGWYMVKSGLVDRPDVSHYRLALHLGLAFFLFAYLFWQILDLRPKTKSKGLVPGYLATYAKVILAFVSIQIVWGAFTAGLKAGYGFNTFPTMNGQWIPSGFWMPDPVWSNFFENNISVQFIHRTLAWILLALFSSFFVLSRRFDISARQAKAVWAVSAAFLMQFCLGIATLLLMVPIQLASLHQLGGFVLFGATVFMVHSFRTGSLKTASA